MPCAGCEARQQEIEHLRKQVGDLTDKLLALANPIALAASRGQMVPVQQPVVTPQGMADVVDDQGRGYVLYDGQMVPLEEYRRVMEKVSTMASGG